MGKGKREKMVKGEGDEGRAGRRGEGGSDGNIDKQIDR